VKGKGRVATSSPWAHAAPAADDVAGRLRDSVDEALERPQRLRGLLARMRGEGQYFLTTSSRLESRFVRLAQKLI